MSSLYRRQALVVQLVYDRILDEPSDNQGYDTWIRQCGELIVFLEPDDSRELFDEFDEAARKISMCGPEFVAAWHEDRFKGPNIPK